MTSPTPPTENPPGLACPNCGTFIEIDLKDLLADKAIACPNPQCRTELRLVGNETAQPPGPPKA